MFMKEKYGMQEAIAWFWQMILICLFVCVFFIHDLYLFFEIYLDRQVRLRPDMVEMEMNLLKDLSGEDEEKCALEFINYYGRY